MTMRRFVLIALALTLATPAQAQWWNWPYAPWRIQPGFRAPPLPDPYAFARARSYGVEVAPVEIEPPPVAYAPPAPPPLGWIYGPYTLCADPPACRAVVINVGADGLNFRVVPNGPVLGALANGVPVIPLRQDGNWLLVAAGCGLAPTWTFSWTAGVPLSVCM